MASIGKNELSDLAEIHAAKAGVAGAQVAVLVDDEVRTASVGFADAEARAPMTDANTLPIASVTKPMVATVVAGLAARGRLSLDDRVASRVPELAASSWAGRATIRQLLANTSGVPLRREPEFDFPATGDDALAQLASSIANDPPLTPPGDVWGYANTGWSLLGRVIEVATDSVWEDAMRAELFAPLGMSSSRFFHERNVVQPSERYLVEEGERRRAPPWENRANGPGGAGLWSSVRDLIAFIRPQVDGAYPELRDPSSSPPIPNFLDDWCLGMARFRYEGGPVWGWDGIGPGHRAILRFLPGRGAIALLANTASGREMYRSLFPVLFERCFGVTMPAVPRTTGARAPLAAFEGTYAWADLALTVAVSGAALTLTQAGSAPVVLERVDEATFAFDPSAPADGTLTFADFDARGRPQMLYRLVWPFPRRAVDD